MMAIVFRVAVGSVLFAAQCLAESQPRIAIIIDDLGYQLDAGRRAIDLPGPVVCAILPGTPRARQLAQGAHDNGKEVLLHLPLQATARRGPLEPGGITLDMSRARLSAVFAEAIESVPFAAGVSSHRGSLLTRHPGHMQWLMETIKSNGYDSPPRPISSLPRQRESRDTAGFVDSRFRRNDDGQGPAVI